MNDINKNDKNKKSIPKVLFLSHGGGPMPLLGDPDHDEMIFCLQTLAKKIPRPSAIIVVSAHWEELQPTITSGRLPPLIYDYYGFPPQAYQIDYPAPGNPELAANLAALLDRHDFQTVLNAQRGFDHGLFVPLKIMYPEADIPCLQLSLLNNLNPAAHIRMGRALAELDGEDILIIGSGFSFHNLREFFAPQTAESRSKNQAFEAWLIDTCSNRSISEDERIKRLENWASAPFARYCHPREEHLLPLHLCYGVSGRACTEVFAIEILRKKASFFLW